MGEKRRFYAICHILNIIASTVLFLMMILTVTDVILRKLFAKSILGTVEITEFMMLLVVFFAIAQAEVRNKHVKVHLIVGRLSEKKQNVIDTFTQFLCSAFFLIAFFSSINYAIKLKKSGEVSQDLWLPLYPFVFLVVIGCAILTVTLFVNFTKSLKKVIRK